MPLLEAEAALGLGLAKPWEVAAALQALWDAKEGARPEFAEVLRRLAPLTDDAVARLKAEAHQLLDEAGGDPEKALTRAARAGAALRSIVGGAPSDVQQAAAGSASASTPLHVVDEGRYVEFQPVGEGGMGLVYWAIDTEMNRQVAFKIVRPDVAGEPRTPVPETPLKAEPPRRDTPASAAFDELKRRFLQEAWVTGGLEHPGVVPVYELGQTREGVPYYTMRFVRGRKTLRQALDAVRSGTVEDRLPLLEPFLKLCDTVRYAHSKGVIHRDLKPENVALGEFGEVVLLDWGLAKLQGREDRAASRWQARVEEFRHAADLRTIAGAMGTAGYMSPEAALGQLEQVDAQSDVYSLGAMLYEILTGRLPFEFRTYGEYLRQVIADDPPDPRSADPGVPTALAEQCLRALARVRGARTVDVQTLATEMRTWQAASALEREVDNLLRDARASLAAAEAAAGAARLVQVDLAVALLGQAASKRADHHELDALRSRAAGLRETAIREREKAAGKKLMARVSVAALALAAVGALTAAGLINEQRGRADRERDEKALALGEAQAAGMRAEAEAREKNEILIKVGEERNEKAWALAEMLRLSDARRFRIYRETMRDLYPKSDESVEEARRLSEAAMQARVSLADHEAALRAVETRGTPPRRVGDGWTAWSFAVEADAWTHDVLSGLVADARALYEAGELRQFDERFRATPAVEALGDLEPRWQRTIDEIRDATISPVYGGLVITPQFGLYPLGKDPVSGLNEFAHVYSGSIPRRNLLGALEYAEDAAIVFVLIPGGTFTLGSPASEQSRESGESPQRVVTLSPFFLAKHECTVAQWARLSGGQQPSWAGEDAVGLVTKPSTRRRPVDHIGWADCVESPGWLLRHGLYLPTEREWAYALRAHAPMSYQWGDTGAWLREHAWFQGNSSGTTHDVGEKLPNAWGLHDMHGNVAEWCRDIYVHALDAFGEAPSATSRTKSSDAVSVSLGSDWSTPDPTATLSPRGVFALGIRGATIGCRVSRAVTVR